VKVTMNSRLIALVLVALAASGWSAQAQWGSIHGNNRGYGGEHEASHGRSGEEHRGPSAPVPHHEAPPAHVEPNRHVEHETRVVPPHVTTEREAHVYRNWDLDEERRHAFFWSGYYAGMPVITLPHGYISVQVGGVPYDYYDGVFYQPGQSGYVVVSPPVGALVPALPPGAEAVVAGPYTYYYAGGAFYIQQPQGFQVVPPPLGITVPYLPAGAATVSINGVLYYQASGAYFLPVMENGATVFTTVQP
jgi:hypothetical protein